MELSDENKNMLHKIATIASNEKYDLPEPKYDQPDTFVEFEKKEKFVNPKREIEGIMTDLVTKDFLKYAESNAKFLNIVYSSFNYAISKYIEMNGVTPSDGLFFVYKGGNVLRMISKVFENSLSFDAAKILGDYYKAYFKKSDADFSIYIDPEIRIKDKADSFEIVFRDMRKLSYLVQLYLRTQFNGDLGNYFDFYRYNDEEKKDVLLQYLNAVKNANSLKDPENEMFYGAEPVSLSYDGIMVGENSDNGGSGFQPNLLNHRFKRESAKYDVRIVDHKSKPNTVVVSPFSKKKHKFYISANSSLSFESAGEKVRFDLVRTKVNVKVKFILPQIKDLIRTSFESCNSLNCENGEGHSPLPDSKELVSNFGGELIDCSIPHRDSPSLAHFFEKKNYYLKDYEMTTISGEKVIFKSYSFHYLIEDLENILFVGSLLPWEDAKYAKRINRVIYLYAYDLVSKGFIDDYKRQNYIAELKEIYEKLALLSKKEFISEIDNYATIFEDFTKKHQDMHSRFDDLINETIRISKNVIESLDEHYDEYSKFIQLVADNLNVILEAFSKRIEYIEGKAKVNKGDMYTKIHSEDFASMAGGGMVGGGMVGGGMVGGGMVGGGIDQNGQSGQSDHSGQRDQEVNNIYQQKYYKYLTKYFKLKNNIQIGGNKRKISGPISCTRHTINDGEYEKDIYIMGDKHKIINPCKENFIEIQNYLEEVFRNTPKLIDFVLEIPMKKQDITKEFDYLDKLPELSEEFIKENFISKIRNKFRDCFIRTREPTDPKFIEDCPYPKVRFHYTDPRDTDLIEIPYFKLIRGFIFLFNSPIPEYSVKIVKKEEIDPNNIYYKIADELYDLCLNVLFPLIENLNKNNDYLIEQYVKLFETPNILSKELNKTGRYKENIKNFSIFNIGTIINNYSQAFFPFHALFSKYKNDKETCKIVIGTNYENILAMIDDIISIFLRSSSIIMDGYVLSRILRDKFEMELESEKYRLNQEKYGKEHIYIKNIIIYAGESHCNNYREFLDYTKEFNRENISIHEKDNINQCIEINDPLFE